jgi:hypothetical protein
VGAFIELVGTVQPEFSHAIINQLSTRYQIDDSRHDLYEGRSVSGLVVVAPVAFRRRLLSCGLRSLRPGGLSGHT